MTAYAVDIAPVIQAAMEPIIQAVAQRSVFLVEDDLVSQVTAATAEATTRTARTVVTFGELVRKGVAGAGDKLEKAHAELAKGAQLATIEAYDAARDAGRHSPPYRTSPRDSRNMRYAAGFLRAAIASSAFTTATPEGILFGNIPLMDAAARQWARLNFGAGAAAGEGGLAGNYNVRWSNLEAVSLGLDEGPRPAFRIPAGYWFGAEFYPVSEVPTGYRRRGKGVVRQEPRMTRGIRAEHWLDAGIAYIANNIGDTYRLIYKQIWDEAKGGIPEVGGVILTRPGRPRSVVNP